MERGSATSLNAFFPVRSSRPDDHSSRFWSPRPTPIHLQPAFADRGWRVGEFPVAEALAGELLCLPIRPDLSADEQDWVAERIRAFFGAGGA